MSYKLKVFDAKGKILSARLLFLNNTLEIRVDVKEVEWPVTIDPIFATEQKMVGVTSDTGANSGSSFVFTRLGTRNQRCYKIPNTTNSLDGGVFTQLKKLIKLHQGMSRSLKLKLIDDYLVTYNKKL